MQRVTVRLPDGLLAALEQAVERGEYADRSEAIRSGVRRELRAGTEGSGRTLIGDGGWPVSGAVDHDDIVPLDMANNITDNRVRQRITWIDGFGRAYADAYVDTSDDSTGGEQP